MKGSTTTAISTLLGAILLVVPGVGQQRDGIAPASGQSARISGSVTIGSDDPQPVRRAVVSAQGRTRGLSFDAITDELGRFDLVGVPAGAYSLTVARPPHVGIAYGATRPGWPGTPLVVNAGEHVVGIRMQVVKGAAITGAVRDERGQPLANVEVWIERRDIKGAHSRSSVVTTDDAGAYRAFGLPAGAYRASARPRGSLNDVLVSSDAGNDAALRILESGGRAWPPGKSSSAAPRVSDSAGVVPVYHPAAVLPDDARLVILHSGEEARGVDIELRPRYSSLLAGRVVSALVVPVSSTFLTLSRSANSGGSATARVSEDGAFSFGRVSPGRYFVLGRLMNPDQLRRVLSSAELASPTPLGPDVCGVVARELEIGESDVPPLQLNVEPCFRVLADIDMVDAPFGGGASPTVSLGLVAEAAGLGRSRMTTQTLQSSGSQRVELAAAGALVPGKYYLEALVAEPHDREWAIDSAFIGGRDVTDEAQFFGSGGGDVVVSVRVSRRATLLSGVLETADARPAVDYTVVAFPTDQAFWKGTFRRVKVTRPSTNGQFEFTGLPGGEYFLAAVRDVAPDEWRQQSFLEEIVPMAIRLTLTPGMPSHQRLRVTGGRE